MRDLVSQVEQKPPVAIGHGAQGRPGFLGQRQWTAQIVFGAPQQDFEILVIEAPQHEDLRTRQQRPDQLEGRVLGRGADENHRAVLDHRQKGILLRAIEAMDLVDEEQRALAHLAALFRRLEDFAQIRDPGENCRQRLENQIGALRQ